MARIWVYEKNLQALHDKDCLYFNFGKISHAVAVKTEQ